MKLSSGKSLVISFFITVLGIGIQAMTYNVPGIILCVIGITGIITTLLYPAIKNMFDKETEYEKGFRLACRMGELERQKDHYSSLKETSVADIRVKEKAIRAIDSEMKKIKKFFDNK